MKARASKQQKLNTIRLLEARGIEHEIIDYDPSIRDARLVAEAVGMSAEVVFKTLVAQAPSSKKPILALIPSNTSLNLKRLAKALGEKKVAMAGHEDAERLTGLKVGGISPLALLDKGWPVYIDSIAEALPRIVISAGRRGTQVRLWTDKLLELVDGELIDVADPM